jgi:acyl carrier protein
MNDAEIYERLAPIFQDVFDNDDVVPHPAMTAEDVEEWDSLSHIRLVVAIEADFGVKFTTPELAKLANVGELVGLIKGKLG